MFTHCSHTRLAVCVTHRQDRWRSLAREGRHKTVIWMGSAREFLRFTARPCSVSHKKATRKIQAHSKVEYRAPSLYVCNRQNKVYVIKQRFGWLVRDESEKGRTQEAKVAVAKALAGQQPTLEQAAAPPVL